MGSTRFRSTPRQSSRTEQAPDHEGSDRQPQIVTTSRATTTGPLAAMMVAMNVAPLARLTAWLGAFSFAALASLATAQDQTWIRQLGTSTRDETYAAAPDDAGGVYFC